LCRRSHRSGEQPGQPHACTRTYEGSRPSTRVWDLVDLALIAELFPLASATLRHEIESTFADRDTHAVPSTLPSPPDGWHTPLRRLAEASGVGGDLRGGHGVAAALLDPILEGAVERGAWNPDAGRWNSP
jgi:hypothetical protein